MKRGFLLDTNVLSEFNRTGQPDERVRQWLSSIPLDSLHVSVITLGEIRFGIELLAASKRRTQLEQWMEREFPSWFEDRILPVNEDIVKSWASLAAPRQRQGRPLSNFDGLIAATALQYGLTLVTRDVKDFEDLGLTLFNPWQPTDREPAPQWPQAREPEADQAESEPERGQNIDRD